MEHDEIVALLSLEETDELFRAAYQVKCRHIGKFEITLQYRLFAAGRSVFAASGTVLAAVRLLAAGRALFATFGLLAATCFLGATG